jgi:hypothetical protein
MSEENSAAKSVVRLASPDQPHPVRRYAVTSSHCRCTTSTRKCE